MSIKCYLPVLNCLTQTLYLYIVKRKDAPLFKTGNRLHHHHQTNASNKGVTVTGVTPLEGGRDSFTIEGPAKPPAHILYRKFTEVKNCFEKWSRPKSISFSLQVGKGHEGKFVWSDGKVLAIRLGLFKTTVNIYLINTSTNAHT